MKSRLTTAVLSVCVLVSSAAMADGWKLSLGASYRSFDEIDFKPLALSSSGGAYVNGYWTADDDYLVLGSDGQINPTGWTLNQGEYWRTVSFDQVVYGGGSDGWGGNPGAVLALSKQLKATESGWSVNAKVSLGWFSADLSTSAQASELTSSTFVGFFRVPSVLGDPGTGFPVAPVVGGSGPGLNQPVYDSGAPATTAAALAMAAEMDLYVLSLGVQLARQMGPVALSLEVGPTLNLVDFDTSVSQTVAWTDGGYSSSAHDDVLDVLFGVYAAGGVSWRFNERFEVGLEARWDEVFEDAETDFAEMDLSGFSVSALFGVSF
ncbi:MAG: hypothetical protein HN380_18570 [Victivallales bacterium]|nr:hypothetical protein [Victivallales bacterium]